jgi:glycosyltransferase involved in cell wall biosynthesis
MSMDNINFALVSYLLLGIFSFAFLLQLWFYLRVFSGLAFYKKKEQAMATPPVSVIICAKNEDDNLPFFLPSILEQDYPDFEVVVVNDCSYDNTADILEEYARRYPHMKIVTIKEDEHYSHGKKFALMVGIKGATHEHLLLTDADCYPASSNWIRHMVSEYREDAEIILGYGAYEKTKGFLNKMIRFDTFYIALQYFSFSLIGKTYMGVGRNLSYKKSLFFKMKGFASHYHIESGDDDLFINEAATKRNSRIEIALDSHTVSRVKTTFKSWLIQKRRHITTAKHYNAGSKVRLGLLSFSQYLLYVSFISLLVFQIQPLVIISLFVFRLFIQMLIFKKSMDKLNESDLWPLSFFMEMVMMVVYPVIFISNLFVKKHTWR